ncbi:hypothetical protein ACIBF1_18805 [Spirillospora sp. NPDC050679]
MKQGDVVLIWGATGGLGSYATQLVKNGGGIPVGVVSSEDKADLVRAQGCDHVINRNDLNLGEQGLRHPKAGRVLGEAIRNRFLWMRLKSIIGSHGFNYHEAVETNQQRPLPDTNSRASLPAPERRPQRRGLPPPVRQHPARTPTTASATVESVHDFSLPRDDVMDGDPLQHYSM